VKGIAQKGERPKIPKTFNYLMLVHIFLHQNDKKIRGPELAF
jgi:hypothetical protein